MYNIVKIAIIVNLPLVNQIKFNTMEYVGNKAVINVVLNVNMYILPTTIPKKVLLSQVEYFPERILLKYTLLLANII